VIVACPEERYATWSSVLKGMAVDGEIFTDQDDHLGIIGISGHGKRRTMVVAAGPLNIRDRMVKRAFDLAFSTVALLLLSPLLIATAIAIKLGSKGPVLFVQDRIGRDNKIFKVYKFRSMYVDMCDADGSRLTSRGDDRVTRVGEFIRHTSIDELPQLLNVFRGDMSMVGPRPHAISAKAADLLYWEVDPRYRHRHSMKPGLTGLAQVRGFRGATDRAEDLTNRLIADLEYASNWSIWRDIWIIVQTLRVLRHDNAY
jgi:polysaccharide biosynthesis protein PslA